MKVKRNVISTIASASLALVVLAFTQPTVQAFEEDGPELEDFVGATLGGPGGFRLDASEELIIMDAQRPASGLPDNNHNLYVCVTVRNESRRSNRDVTIVITNFHEGDVPTGATKTVCGVINATTDVILKCSVEGSCKGIYRIDGGVPFTAPSNPG